MLAVLLVMAASLGGYVASREYSEQPSALYGVDPENPDRVDIAAWVTRVDVNAQRATIILADMRPTGALAADDGTFAEAIELETNAVQNVAIEVAPGEDLPNVEQDYALTGTVTDFPFDSYIGYMSFRLTRADGSEVPFAMTVESTDAFFMTAPYYDDEQSDWVNIDLSVQRTLPTTVFGVFIMILMLGLALAAAIVAYYVIRHRKGFELDAYAVMAALLFAMVPLRNAVPGDPPIGSVIDFMSFFIAEAVISVSLVASVVVGYRHQLTRDAEIS